METSFNHAGDVAAMSHAASREVLENAVRQSAEDPAFFARFFLRNWFPSPIPPFHLGMLALFNRKVEFLDKYPDAHEFLLNHFSYLADPNDPESTELPVFQLDSEGKMMMVAGANNAIIVPRGFSKTTLKKASDLHELVTDPRTFSVYVSESADHAIRQLGDIRRQLESNKLLRAAYGDVVPARTDSEKWGADEIQLKTGAILLARGRGSQVRGLLYDGRRPNRITLDDVEDKESVATAAQREKVSDWFYGDVVPAGNLMERDADFDPDTERQQELQITVLGTLLHSECLLITLQKDVTFNHVRFGAKLENGQMLWPAKMGEATYNFQRERYRRNGKLAEFCREYDSTIRVEEDALFQYKDISIYQPTPFTALIQRAQACDPAISDQPGRDHCTILIAGRREDGALWFLEEWGGLGKTPREVVDQLFEFHLRFKLHVTGIESQQYQKSLVFLLREEMARKQLFFNVKPIIQGNDKSKDDRIAGILQPRYANGYIRHQKVLPRLEQQLLDFPNGKKDYADAAAMALSLLGETQFLAAPEGSAFQDEYEPLPPLEASAYSPSNNQVFTPTPVLGRGRYG